MSETTTDTPIWHKTACILCECNCGIEVRLGADGHTFERIRGDKDHPASQGYTCEKALRLDHYQNGRGERVLNPLRRRPDGTFEEVDWGTAVREVAARLAAVRDAHGGDKILYYGGGGQGNHLCGAYGAALHKGFGGRFRSSAIAQEKSGEVLVNGTMFGNAVRGEFDECEVAFIIGKNPYQSHSIPHARTTLKAIANDPGRSMVVIDPRVTETAELADFHLRSRLGGTPGCSPRWSRSSSRSACTPTPGSPSTPTGATRSTPASPRSTSPSTARSPVSTRTSFAGRRGGSPRRRASPCSRTSASR